MTGQQRDFNHEAAAWDSNRERVRVANAIADAMIDALHPAASMDVLDFGCGTGLLTLRFQPFVRSITGVDSAQGMLDVLTEKIRQGDLRNVKARLLDVEKGDILSGTCNLVVSSMTLHHIRQLPPLFRQFSGILAPGGQLAVADLDPDDGQFHDSNDGVYHYGFDRAALRAEFEQAGFEDVQDRTAAHITKPCRVGGTRRFPVFLMTGRKK